ncbi:hypothetical protein [Kribbella sp. CA-294648]|uniref:hypothetical protein n=1 Tax=Kribbella sp. CA-294648 TaxID=3239948 RepID=UPI003D945826
MSRWRNPSPKKFTKQGTSTLKAAYAQAMRDVKRMDPAVLAAIGRSGMNSSDLKHLAHANVEGLYGNGHERFAQQINAQASAQVQATTPSHQKTRNPFKKLSRWNENRKDVRAGKQILKQAYAQAKSEVKRVDPKVREAIGRSGVNKQDLKMLSHAQLSGVVRNGIEQAAQQHYTQARAAAAAVAARPDPVRQTMGQRTANVVNTASRWSKAVADGSRAVANGAKEKAEKFAADYNERRQNPTGRSAQQPTAAAAAPGREEAAAVQVPTPAEAGPAAAQVPTPAEAAPAAAQVSTPAEAAPVAAVDDNGPPTLVNVPVVPENAAAAAQAAPDLPAAKAAEAKSFHAALNNTMPMPAAEAQQTGGRHRAPEVEAGSNGPTINGPVNGVQVASGNTGPVTQTQNGVANAPAGQQSGEGGKPAKSGPPAPGADPAMAPASAAVATKPAAQAAAGHKGEAANSHNKHRKPDSPER